MKRRTTPDRADQTKNFPKRERERALLVLDPLAVQAAKAHADDRVGRTDLAAAADDPHGPRLISAVGK